MSTVFLSALKNLSAIGSCLVGLLLMLGGSPASAQSPIPSPAPVTCPSTLQHTFPRLQDEALQSLCQYSGKVILVVNTASFCGFTPQYKGLEALYTKYRGRGLVVLGFPSNDFAQESGNNQQIADFCENTFGVKFPMFTKTTVSGPQAAPFFRQLASQSGQPPRWNFHKYLLGRNGKVVASYASQVNPEDRTMSRDIERQLAEVYTKQSQ